MSFSAHFGDQKVYTNCSLYKSTFGIDPCIVVGIVEDSSLSEDEKVDKVMLTPVGFSPKMLAVYHSGDKYGMDQVTYDYVCCYVRLIGSLLYCGSLAGMLCGERLMSALVAGFGDTYLLRIAMDDYSSYVSTHKFIKPRVSTHDADVVPEWVSIPWEFLFYCPTTPATRYVLSCVCDFRGFMEEFNVRAFVDSHPFGKVSFSDVANTYDREMSIRSGRGRIGLCDIFGQLFRDRDDLVYALSKVPGFVDELMECVDTADRVSLRMLTVDDTSVCPQVVDVFWNALHSRSGCVVGRVDGDKSRKRSRVSSSAVDVA